MYRLTQTSKAAQSRGFDPVPYSFVWVACERIVVIGEYSGRDKGNRRMKRKRSALIFGLVLATSIAAAKGETVDVKYRGQVDLKSFDSADITRSSFIKRVCYDQPNKYMLINLNGTYYHYCQIDPETVTVLKTADSMGRYFNAEVKGHFDCRINQMPTY
jgi:hypothetical protein